MGVEVVGVSGDTVDGLALFKEVNGLNFTLLSDETGAIAKQFGVPLRKGGTITKTVDDKEVQLTQGVRAKRWTFLIGMDGKIVYKNTAVKAVQDSKDVLAVVKGLSQGE